MTPHASVGEPMKQTIGTELDSPCLFLHGGVEVNEMLDAKRELVDLTEA